MLIQSELMDFQTHLYKFGEMEQYLKEMGFIKIKPTHLFSKSLHQEMKCSCLSVVQIDETIER